MKQIYKYSVKWFDHQRLIQPCKSIKELKSLISALIDNENVKDIEITKIPEDNNVDETTCKHVFIRTTRNYKHVYRCALCNLISNEKI
jgi:hypothetical protein